MLDGIRDSVNPVLAKAEQLARPFIEPFLPPPIEPIVPAPARLPEPPAQAGWADGVSGQRSQSIDLDMMRMADAAYDPSRTQVGNWNRVSDADLRAAGLNPADFEDSSTGFRAGLYTDGKGHYTLAFAGSNGGNDWVKTNIPQGLGMQTEQYDQAVALAQQVADSPFGNQGNLVLTGHSLGGGLAGIASLVTDTPAVTFDASGVHDDTIRQFGLDPAAAKADAEAGLIRRYNVDGDPLTAAQQDAPGLSSIMPDAPGHEITLADPLPPLEAPKWDWRHPIESGKAQIEHQKDKLERVGDLHRQSTMIQALETQRPWED